jgi:hypothetical protein
MPIFIDVTLHGSIPAGVAPAIIHRYKVHLEEKLGDLGVNLVRAYLPTQYMYLGQHGGTPRKNPVPPGAGALVASIHTRRDTTDAQLVVGDDLIYGPWIEGVAIGNTFFYPGRVRAGQSARFPGYHTFRKMTQVLDQATPDIAYTEIQPYIREINNY